MIYIKHFFYTLDLKWATYIDTSNLATTPDLASLKAGADTVDIELKAVAADLS